MEDFFRSNSFANHRKNVEGRQKLSMAYIERMDGLAKQLGGVGGAIVKVFRALASRR